MRMRGLVAVLAMTAAMLAAPAPAMAALPSGACALPMGDVGRTDWNLYLRPAGTVRAIMLFVDFSDDAAQTSPDSYVERLKPAESWFRTASGGKLDLAITAHKHWHRMPKPSSAYDLDGTITFERHRAYLRDAVRAADNHVNFGPYDILYVVSPRTAQRVPISPAFTAYQGAGINEDGNELRHGAVIGQDMWNPGWGRHLLVHETGHVFGLPDLYAYDSGDFHRFMGGWDVMGSIDGPGRDFLIWHKWRLGWLTAERIRCETQAGTTERRISRVGDGNRAVVIRTSRQRAYVVEVRRKTGLNSGICRQGVLIYRVDNAIASGDGPIRVMRALGDSSSKQFECGQWYNAPFKPGQSFSDSNAGVRITVLSGNDDTYRIRVRRATTYSN